MGQTRTSARDTPFYNPAARPQQPANSPCQASCMRRGTRGARSWLRTGARCSGWGTLPPG
eukprot:9628288-Alexandrium_andersonii.AAC.1